jgi:hypothetical protein
MDTVTIRIPLVKKQIACCECRYFHETAVFNDAVCLFHQKLIKDVSLTCKPKKSWKAK